MDRQKWREIVEYSRCRCDACACTKRAEFAVLILRCAVAEIDGLEWSQISASDHELSVHKKGNNASTICGDRAVVDWVRGRHRR